MADTKITALPAVSSVNGAEIIPVVKGGTNQIATVNQIKTYLGVSGTNTGDQDLSSLVPKTTTVNGHALSANVAVTASDVGLGNVDNTSDANKPVSTATSTALDGKQAILISATNIKTINGNSVLGSGNLTVSGSGTVTSVSVVTANGLAGTVATSTTTPAITLTTSVTGLVKGNGTALSAATAGTDYTSPSSTETMTNKRMTARVGSTTSSATPTINTNNVDIYKLTAQAADITSFTTNLSGTPTDNQCLIIEITGTAARAITWGASFEASTVALPTTTVTTAMLAVAFLWNTATSKWRCVAAV